MGALLVEEWLRDEPAVALHDDAAVAVVRRKARELAAARGLSVEAAESLTTAASEIAQNALVHGSRGRALVRAIERHGVPGVEVVVADSGAGISNPSAALRGGHASSTGLGQGLAGAYRMADEMDFDVRWGEGTYASARKFKDALPRCEIAMLGRPLPGEPTSGDHAGFLHETNRLRAGVADGLGHGPLAREAADRAVRGFYESTLQPVADVLAECDARLSGSRGAVMAVAEIDLSRCTLTYAGAGNIAAAVSQVDASQRFGSKPYALGSRRRGFRAAEEAAPFPPGSVLVMHTDGLSSRTLLSNDGLRREPPLVIAHTLLERFGQATDDALVVVVRLG